MHALLQEMIHYVNGLESGAGRDPEKLLEYETRYDQILERALAEYADVPCSDYYRDGFNLATRLKGYRDSHLLFLHDSVLFLMRQEDGNLYEKVSAVF